MGKRVGLGMNEFELKENKQLTEYVSRVVIYVHEFMYIYIYIYMYIYVFLYIY